MAKASLDRDELLALLRAAKAHNERNWLMILIAFSHGLRASEVVALRPDNFHRGKLYVKRLKGSLPTAQPLVSSTDPLLDEEKGFQGFLKVSEGNLRLFPITRERFWQLMQRYGKDAGIHKSKRHPHILKHTIGMQTIQSAGIENVRQYLGHKSIASTGEYLKVTDDKASVAISKALVSKVS